MIIFLIFTNYLAWNEFDSNCLELKISIIEMMDHFLSRLSFRDHHIRYYHVWDYHIGDYYIRDSRLPCSRFGITMFEISRFEIVGDLLIFAVTFSFFPFWHYCGFLLPLHCWPQWFSTKLSLRTVLQIKIIWGNSYQKKTRDFTYR